jgi:hypothetical protein
VQYYNNLAPIVILYFILTKIMPIIESAKKALKQSVKKHSRNEHFRDMYKETRKAFELAIKNSDVE